MTDHLNPEWMIVHQGVAICDRLGEHRRLYGGPMTYQLKRRGKSTRYLRRMVCNCKEASEKEQASCVDQNWQYKVVMHDGRQKKWKEHARNPWHSISVSYELKERNNEYRAKWRWTLDLKQETQSEDKYIAGKRTRTSVPYAE